MLGRIFQSDILLENCPCSFPTDLVIFNYNSLISCEQRNVSTKSQITKLSGFVSKIDLAIFFNNVPAQREN